MLEQTTVTIPRPGEGIPSGAQRPRRKRSPGMLVSTVKYLLRTDVHTFAFSVAANSILAFFPFVVLLMTLIHRVFHSRVMYDVVVELLRDYLPAGREFVIRNLKECQELPYQYPNVTLVDQSVGEL